jgi:hypothetical protein
LRHAPLAVRLFRIDNEPGFLHHMRHFSPTSHF